MKKIISALIILLFSVSVYAKDIQELIVTTTPPMSCQNCENKIKGNLRFEKGVKKIETNLKDQRVTVEYDADKTDPQKIEAAFEKIGYHVDVICEEGITNTTKPKTCNGTCCGNKVNTEQSNTK